MLVSFSLEMVLILTQDRCTVWADGNPMELLGDVGPKSFHSVEARFSLFGDSANLDAR
jgi:hypothetical protein